MACGDRTTRCDALTPTGAPSPLDYDLPIAQIDEDQEATCGRDN